MKAFLDTSVLVATFYADHEHHAPSIDIFLRFGNKAAGCGAHGLAEVYATLTGLPSPSRVSGDEAMLFLSDIRERLTVVALNDREYFEMAEASASAGLAGGAIFDAVLGHCALKARAEVLYTWNPRDYLRLSPAIAERVKDPGQQ